jgi:hypothetical protein
MCSTINDIICIHLICTCVKLLVYYCHCHDAVMLCPRGTEATNGPTDHSPDDMCEYGTMSECY